jgi:hypothetical protein
VTGPERPRNPKECRGNIEGRRRPENGIAESATSGGRVGRKKRQPQGRPWIRRPQRQTRQHRPVVGLRRQASVEQHVSRLLVLSPDPTSALAAAGVACGTRFAVHGGVSQPSSTYEPRTPSQGAVYQVVRDHFETFGAQAAGLREAEGLPRFVEQAAFARSASASHAVALSASARSAMARPRRRSKSEVGAEAGVSRVAALRRPGGRLCALPL